MENLQEKKPLGHTGNVLAELPADDLEDSLKKRVEISKISPRKKFSSFMGRYHGKKVPPEEFYRELYDFAWNDPRGAEVMAEIRQNSVVAQLVKELSEEKKKEISELYHSALTLVDYLVSS